MKYVFLKRLTVRLIPAFILMIGTTTTLFAQQGTITGHVSDADNGEDLPGVNVVLESITLGGATDLDGNYTIANVPPGTYSLSALFLGYTPLNKVVTVVAGDTVVVDFELRFGILGLEELVVTATGVRRRVEIGNSTARIDATEQAKIRPLGNVSDLLQGQATGVQVLESGGSVGMGSRIRIRGSNSASLSNEPVIYVDGVLYNNSPNSISFETGGQSPSRLNDISQDDIESIEIIKGPSATTLYGSIAANGVIRITTKRGKLGRARWSAYTETGAVTDVGDYPKNFQSLDASGNACFTFQIAEGSCSQSKLNSFQPLTDPSTSPFQTGQSYGMGLNVSGGTDALTYYMSGNYNNADGVVEVNNVKRMSFRGNFGSQVTKKLKVDLTTGYTSSDMSLPLNDNFALGMMGQGLNGGATNEVNDGWGEFTPAELFTIDTRQNINRFTTGLTSKYEFSNALQLQVSGGLDFTNRWDNQFFPTGKAPAFLNYDQGARFSNRFNEFVYTLDAVGSYSADISSSIKSRTAVGLQYLRNLTEGTLSTGLQIVAGSSSIAGAANTFSVEQTIEQRTIGVFIEQQVNFNEKLFLTGAVRADQGSAFGESLSTVYYPKLSASWVMSDESFFPKDSNILSSVRLRGAWGQSGVQPGSNAALRFFNPIAATVDGGQNVTGVTFGSVGNADLKPERSTELEFGADLTLFYDRVGLEVTYFNKSTSDALIFRQLPLSLGVGNGRFENLGSVTNSGFELGMNFRIVDTGSSVFDLQFVGSFLKNELTKLGEGIEPVIFGVQRHVEGYELGGYWDESFTFSDANGDGLIGRDEVQVSDDVVFLGSPFAPTDISFIPRISFLNDQIIVSGLLNYRGGMKLYNNTGAWRNGNSNTEALNDVNASLADQARSVASKFYGTNAGYIEDASFWRLREVSLTVGAPRQWLAKSGLSRLSLTVSGRNLWIASDYSGLDPEISSSGQSNFTTQEFLSQPPLRSWRVRLNFSF